MPLPFATLLALTSTVAPAAIAAAPAPLVRAAAAAAEADELIPEVEYATAEEASGAAKEAMRAGDFERAREILGQVVLVEHFEKGRAALADDNPARALTWLDRALDIAPRDVALRTYRAEGLLALANQSLANGGSGVFVGSAFEDAARAFKGLPDSPRAAFGEAQSLIMLNRAPEALAVAERAAANVPDLAALSFSFGDPISILGQAAYLAFAEQAQGVIDADPGSDPAALAETYSAAAGRVAQLVAARPTDPGSWNTAANLELYQGAATGDAQHTDRALSALREGLAALPGDATLLAALVRVSNQAGGAPRAVRELQAVAQTTGDLPNVAMELGKQRFFNAVGSFPQAADAAPEAYAQTRELFSRAQADFAAVRAMPSEVDLGAGAWEAVCQAGEGWAELFGGNYTAAIPLFLETEDVLPGGLRTDFAGNVESGLRGLQTVLARYAAAGAEGDGESLLRAAELASTILSQDPDGADSANNAGFFNRDAAVALENSALAFCRAAAGQADDAEISDLRRAAEIAPELYGTEAEKRQFRERANALLERARATMRTSADAYLRAAELAPDDARVQNDTGLVFVHYLHTDLERAEAFLREAVRLGEAQLAEADPADEGFAALTEAYGDAHENLGVLHLEFLNSPDTAKNYFERSVEIGPYERPIVTRYYLPRIEGSDQALPARPVTDWGRACE